MKKYLLGLALMSVVNAYAQQSAANQPVISKQTTTAPKMKIEIWSDVMCPFCYIGKRKFEAALAQFAHRDEVEIVWKSFQLAPDLEVTKPTDCYTYLAEAKGQTRDWSVQMHNMVTQTAKSVGLDYRFDRAVVANTTDAHRLIQLAKTHQLGDQAEERLFKAYFTEGKNIADHATLAILGEEIGLKKEAVLAMLQSTQFADLVSQEHREGEQIGVQGVPFFVMDRKYGVSGAQDPQVFLKTLEQSFAEWRKNNPALKLNVIDGQTCTPKGECK